MKSFKNYILSEEVDLTANVERGVIDVHDHAVRDNINAFLNGELAGCVVTPYIALNKANKVLANFHIFLPKAPYMEDNHGVHVFPIVQFNRAAGMKNDGSVVTKVGSPYSLFFEWKRNEKGMFDVFAEIVTEEELSDLLDVSMKDVDDSESEREEKLDEQAKWRKTKGAYTVDDEGRKVSVGDKPFSPKSYEGTPPVEKIVGKNKKGKAPKWATNVTKKRLERSRDAGKQEKANLPEESEQLNEISKEKKDEYVKRASSDWSMAHTQAKHSEEGSKAHKLAKKVMKKRGKGLNLALKEATKVLKKK